MKKRDLLALLKCNQKEAAELLGYAKPSSIYQMGEELTPAQVKAVTMRMKAAGITPP